MDHDRDVGQTASPLAAYRVFDDLLEGAQVISPELTYLYLNEAACRQGRLSKEALLGRSMLDVFPHIATTELYRRLKRCLELTEPEEWINEFTHRDGSMELFHLRIQAVPEGALVFSFHVTEQARAARILRDTNQTLESTVAAKVHELRQAEEERALFLTMIEKAGDPFFLIDDDDGCRMLYVNEAAAAHFGASREEIYTWRIPDWDPHFSYERLEEHVAEIKKTKNLSIQSDHKTKKGGVVPVEISLNYLEYKGRICHFGWFRNISERLRAENETRLFKEMVEKAAEPFFVIDPEGDGRMVHVNDAAAAHFGASPEEIYSWRIPDWDPNFTYETLPNLVKTVKAAQNLTIETTHRLKNGAIVPVEVTANYFTSDQGQPLIYGWFKDITERQRIARLKDDFVSTVSHELRTPLTAIKGALGLVTGGAVGEVPERMASLLAIANNNTERLLHLINDLLDLQKIESGKLHFHFAAVELGALVESAIHDNQSYANAREVRLVVEEHEEGVMVFADRHRVMQVLANLLSNAAKFSPPGDRVLVRVAEREGLAQVSVRDHGPGIPEKARASLFEKFMQVDSSDRRSAAGSGLGLNIAQLLAERHGGKIRFECDATGTTFFFELPALSIEPATERQPSEKPLLLLEPDPRIAEALTQRLRREGLAVEWTNTLQAAQQRLESGAQHYRAAVVGGSLIDEALPAMGKAPPDEDGRPLPMMLLLSSIDGAGRWTAGAVVERVDWLSMPFDSRHLRALVPAPEGDVPPRVLVVDAEGEIALVIASLLNPFAQVRSALGLSDARVELGTEDYDLVLVHVTAPSGVALDLLELINAHGRPRRFALLSKHRKLQLRSALGPIDEGSTGQTDPLGDLVRALREAPGRPAAILRGP